MTKGKYKKNFHLVSLQDPDLDTKMAARQMKADSSRHKSMHSSLVVAVTCGVLGFSTHHFQKPKKKNDFNQ